LKLITSLTITAILVLPKYEKEQKPVHVKISQEKWLSNFRSLHLS